MNPHILKKPTLTEKTLAKTAAGCFTFEVAKGANKAMVSKAISALYKVNPIKVAMINTPVRNVFVKGRKGTVSGVRKAIVTVKKGDKIDFV